MTMTPDARAGSPSAQGTSTAETVWRDVLRDYRASLTEQRELLGRVHDEHDLEGFDRPVGFDPPYGLPPIPASLHADAAALDAETAELLASARELLSHLRPPSTTPVHRSILAPPSPSQMDTRL